MVAHRSRTPSSRQARAGILAVFGNSQARIKALADRPAHVEQALDGQVRPQVASMQTQLDQRIGELLAAVGSDPQARAQALLGAVASRSPRPCPRRSRERRSCVPPPPTSRAGSVRPAAGPHRPRETRALDEVHRAGTHGYVSVFFAGGYDDLNSYADTVVRPGEYWTAASRTGAERSGVVCVFTPFL